MPCGAHFHARNVRMVNWETARKNDGKLLQRISWFSWKLLLSRESMRQMRWWLARSVMPTPFSHTFCTNASTFSRNASCELTLLNALCRAQISCTMQSSARCEIGGGLLWYMVAKMASVRGSSKNWRQVCGNITEPTSMTSFRIVPMKSNERQTYARSMAACLSGTRSATWDRSLSDDSANRNTVCSWSSRNVSSAFRCSTRDICGTEPTVAMVETSWCSSFSPMMLYTSEPA